MKKLLLLTVIAIFTISTGYSQTLWTKTNESRIGAAEKSERASFPTIYELYTLDLAAMKNALQKAPSRDSEQVSTVIIQFPNAEGQLEKFRIYESSIMEAPLAERHPDIKSYVGQGIDDPTAAINISTTIFGLHAMTLSGKGTSYIDTYTKDLKNYIVYNKRNLRSDRKFSCGTESAATDVAGMPSSANVTMANDSKLRTYRLAMACTIEYAAFHVNNAPAGTPIATEAQKKAVVLAAMGVSLTRINGIYERDLAIRMVLVANNTNIIFITSDNFSNNNANQLISQSQSVITSTIGVNNFDLGHTVSTGDGGVAALGGVCFSNAKAAAITGNPAPVGDPFDIDYVAHEMGHQFGAEHTFNSVSGGACDSSTRSAAQAVEPGSGSTIMAYAGICMENVQNNSDAYFHTISIAEIQANITSSSTCVPGVNNNNTPPVIPNLTGYTIPKGTPFFLTGTATDPNGDTMTYCWEQINANGSTAMPSPNTTSGPSFRSFPPTTSPTRYFPSLSTLTSGYGSPYEVLPNVNRTMNFAFTVRDNAVPNGGQTSRKDVAVAVSTAGGPFEVTSQNTDNISWMQGQTQTITWNVNNTTAAPFNVSNVRIKLSTDGGLTYPTVLVESTPNDGSETITVPAVAAPFCRIMVESIGNIFFAINSKTFAIGYTVETVCNTFTNNTPLNIPDGTGINQPQLGNIAQAVLNVPFNSTISTMKFNINISHTYISDLLAALVHPDGTQLDLWTFVCNNQDGLNATLADGAPAPNCPAGQAIITGTFAPIDAFSQLAGKPTNGNWIFLAADAWQQDAGTVNSWGIEFCTQISTPLSTENPGLVDFSIYPNPNNGNFNFDFNSLTNNDINVSVHDLSGRLIYQNAYTNTGRISQNVQLNTVQAGVYVVTVQDGNSKEVKKIVID
jgi:subtilisin-like proprotein convertase family protein